MKRIILILLFCFMHISFHNIEVKYSYDNTDICDTSFLSSTELNDSILYLALLHYNIKHPRIVLALAKLESGNYTSNLYKRGNNFLGLYDSRRNKYFTFSHWSECIEAYKSMIEYKHRDGEDYYDFLIRANYAEDPNYIHKVRQIVNNLKI